MKTLKQVKLETKISDLIVAAFEDITRGEISREDLVDISTGLSMRIVYEADICL